jgi:hypothetical protein
VRDTPQPYQLFCVADFSPFCRCRIHFPAHVYGRVLLVRVHVYFPGCPGLRNRSRRDPSTRWRAGRYHSMKAWHTLTSSFLSSPSPPFPALRHFVHVTDSRIITDCCLLYKSQLGCYLVFFRRHTGSHLSYLFLFVVSFVQPFLVLHHNSHQLHLGLYYNICRVWLRIDASFL